MIEFNRLNRKGCSSRVIVNPNLVMYVEPNTSCPKDMTNITFAADHTIVVQHPYSFVLEALNASGKD
jgi:hypothetical protein